MKRGDGSPFLMLPEPRKCSSFGNHFFKTGKFKNVYKLKAIQNILNEK